MFCLAVINGRQKHKSFNGFILDFWLKDGIQRAFLENPTGKKHQENLTTGVKDLAYAGL